MNWTDHIHSDPKILSGKPVIKGTRLSVLFLLEQMASGWSEQKILDNYPFIDQIKIQAIRAFADQKRNAKA